MESFFVRVISQWWWKVMANALLASRDFFLLFFHRPMYLEHNNKFDFDANNKIISNINPSSADMFFFRSFCLSWLSYGSVLVCREGFVDRFEFARKMYVCKNQITSSNREATRKSSADLKLQGRMVNGCDIQHGGKSRLGSENSAGSWKLSNSTWFSMMQCG